MLRKEFESDPNAFRNDFAVALNGHATVLMRSDPAAAATALRDGIAVLATPASFRCTEGLWPLGLLSGNYRSACEAAGIVPDEALLGPIEAALATLPPAP